MGHQGHPLTRKRQHLSRKRDTNVDQVQVPHTVQVAGADHFDSGYLMRFQSREGIFNQILEALRDEKISRVGLYGMGGSGKTTLAKQVGKRAKELNIFNQVVVVPVAGMRNVKRIQGDIAAGLGLRLGEEDDLAARQRQISLRLRNQERALIILDDVWLRLDLQEIGILNDVSQMGCKVLLTLRTREVGYLMECQLSFHLFLLSDEEAWQLLIKRAGMDDRPPDLIVAAKGVAKYCQGLPLTISVVASALRGKTVDQWMQVSKIFRSTVGKASYWEDGSPNAIIRTIHLSYNASSKVAKTIFLICALFPEDHEIPIEDLSQYAIRLGLCSKNEVNAAINSLKDSCLLMHSDTSKDHVIMHGVVRDIALNIVRKENPAYGDSIREYMNALNDDGEDEEGFQWRDDEEDEEDFQWREELDRLLLQLYGVTERSSSSTSDATFHGGEGRELQVVRPHSHIKAATIPQPSGKLVDFKGLCRVDKSFLPLLKEVCARKPHLIESQRRHSEIVRSRAFDCLGLLLFMLHNVRNRDWVHHKDELRMFWEQLMAFKFDLGWLHPTVEGVLSSAEIARIEALQAEEEYFNEEAAKLREQLKIVENKAAVARTEIGLTESKLDGFAIAEVSKVRVTRSLKKFFCKKNKICLLRNLVSSK